MEVFWTSFSFPFFPFPPTKRRKCVFSILSLPFPSTKQAESDSINSNQMDLVGIKSSHSQPKFDPHHILIIYNLLLSIARIWSFLEQSHGNKLWVIVGNFNITFFQQDKMGVKLGVVTEILTNANMLNYLEVFDIKWKGAFYTWTNLWTNFHQGNDNNDRIWFKLD